MAACTICSADVETNKYVRAAPVTKQSGKYKAEAKGFYCLSHGIGEIEEAIAVQFPPNPDLPILVSWNPAKGVSVPTSPLVQIGNTPGAAFGVRKILAGDRQALHLGIQELVPKEVLKKDPSTNHAVWDVKRPFGGTQGGIQSLAYELGHDHPAVIEAKAAIAAKRGKGK